MLGLVWPAYCSFGMVSRSLAPLVSGVTADLGVAYAGGRVIDRVGLRWALGLGLLAIGASGILRAGASGFGTMFAFVALFGLGGPMVSIAAPKLIATWFEGAERGKAAGIYTTGPALLGYLFDLTGGFVVGLALNAALLATVAAGCLRLDREATP